jgi:plasmid stabilization system protein ParE
MDLEVFWSDFAKNKLEEIFDYYKLKASLKVANKIVNGIVNRTINLNKTPRIGQVEEIFKDDEREFRYLVYTNYKILYYINLRTNQIIIANVFDTRQNPEKLRLM